MTAETKGIRADTMQEFKLDNSYRLYLTMDQWILTKDDHDLARIQRRKEHWSDGYCLLMLEIMYQHLCGRMTLLRDRWALFQEDYEREAKELHTAMLETKNKVIELHFEPNTLRVKTI